MRFAISADHMMMTAGVTRIVESVTTSQRESTDDIQTFQCESFHFRTSSLTVLTIVICSNEIVIHDC
jgi:hypothetical protein